MSTPLIWIVFRLGRAPHPRAKKPILSWHPDGAHQPVLAASALAFPRDLSFLLPEQRLEIASTLNLFGRSL